MLIVVLSIVIPECHRTPLHCAALHQNCVSKQSSAGSGGLALTVAANSPGLTAICACAYRCSHMQQGLCCQGHVSSWRPFLWPAWQPVCTGMLCGHMLPCNPALRPCTRCRSHCLEYYRRALSSAMPHSLSKACMLFMSIQPVILSCRSWYGTAVWQCAMTWMLQA